MLIALLLAGNVWVVEPGQALVTIERERATATSLALTGTLREVEGGGVSADLRVPIASFDSRPDGEGEIVFAGVAPAPGKDGVLHLHGTLTIRGVARQLDVPLSLVRAGGEVYCHASFAIGGAGVEVDAGLQRETAVATRG